jgi:RNA polymerase sigma-70 factor (ECF subfamily)
VKLDDWCEKGHARWPRVTVTVDELAAHLARLGITSDTHAHADDIYLACACAAGDAHAIATFEHEFAPVIAAAVRRLDSAGDFVDEVTQVIRERLLVAAPGEPPRIADYSGQGPLQAWVRIAAMRIAMNMLRDRKKNVLVDDERFFEVVAHHAGAAPGSAERYREAATEAVRAAFAALTLRERNLLRMHHLHGLTVDDLAPTLGVHRATVARWIAAARERLLSETRAALASRLDVGDATLDSILQGIASQVEISVVRMLAEE